jgi:hypothetical protein
VFEFFDRLLERLKLRQRSAGLGRFVARSAFQPIENASIPLALRRRDEYRDAWEPTAYTRGSLYILGDKPRETGKYDYVEPIDIDSVTMFKTVDGGQNWAFSSVGLPDHEITFLVIDPSNSATIYDYLLARRIQDH